MLTPWKESYDQPRQHIKKQRHYFVNKGLSSQGYGFYSSHVWIWELDYKESWRLKNWCFELWCWRRLLRVPWTARRSNQSILKEISPGCSLVGLMLKLKFWRADSLEKTLMLGKIEGRREVDDRGWDGWMASPTQWTWVWVNSGSWWWTERPGLLRFMGVQSRTLLSNWTDWLKYINVPRYTNKLAKTMGKHLTKYDQRLKYLLFCQSFSDDFKE